MKTHNHNQTMRAIVLALVFVTGLAAHVTAQPLSIGDRRELFLDKYLIDRLDGAALKMQMPQYTEPPRLLDKPITVLQQDSLRGRTTRYDLQYRPVIKTVFKDGSVFRAYGDWERVNPYRPQSQEMQALRTVNIYSESRDGIHWTQPSLGIHDIPEMPEKNSAVIAYEHGAGHNFCPFLDTRPGVPPEERYKGVGGVYVDPVRQKHILETYGPGGLKGYVSPDGLRWKRVQELPIIPNEWGAFDSHNVAYWSEHEQRYVCYWRVLDNKFTPSVRAVRRSTSTDFIHWEPPVDVKLNDPGEQIYWPNMKPYFRAPHIILALPTRISGNAAAVEGLLACSRDGVNFDRTFPEVFFRPGVGVFFHGPYGNRCHYTSHSVVQTGPAEMSLYTLDGLRRFTLRLDGFSSLSAPYAGGEMTTKPLVFKGRLLEINVQTAGVGSVRIEIQNEAGQPIPGFTLADCVPFCGDDIAHVAAWKAGSNVGQLAGKPVRLRFVMKDADVYSFRFD